MNHESVKEYYGDTLQTSADLQTNACCTSAAPPDHLKAVLAKIHDEVLAKYYGCGLIAPDHLAGMRILDLGCGAGRDVYALAGLVGESGSVVGVDMTEAQLEVARKHEDFHAKAFGYTQKNTEFHLGYIEKLDDLDLEPNSFDIIVSNCVLNLAMDKEAVLRGVYNLLKPGGEMYFSDVYADRRMPEALLHDKVLYGECLSGALYWNDFQHIAKKVGFFDPRVVEDRVLTIENQEIQNKVGPIKFTSATYRLFKIEGLAPSEEDFGQSVIYQGTIETAPDIFTLDKHHAFKTGEEVRVSGNTWRMVCETRFGHHFKFVGNWSKHLGLFEGGMQHCPFGGKSKVDAPSSGGCC